MGATRFPMMSEADVAAFRDNISALIELEPDDASAWFALMRRRYTKDRVVWVYFVQCNGEKGPIKIGVARDVKKRMANLRIGNPYPLLLLVAVEAPVTTESLLHGKFRKYRIHGEWFRPNERVLKFVKELRSVL